MKRVALVKCAERHERMAALYASMGKAKAAAREIRKAEALRKAKQIRQELRRAS